ncbi:hypothetical protein ABPG72_017529 [Tetrahymena utriculariae]
MEFSKADQTDNQTDCFSFNPEYTTKNFKTYYSDIVNELQKKGYKIENFLIEGGQAEVYLIKQTYQKKEYAMKIFYNNNIQYGKEEFEISKRIEQVDYSMQSIEAIEQDKDFYIIIQEKYKYNLKDYITEIIDENDSNFNDQTLLQITFNLLDGLNFLRNYNIIHLDIKPSNILYKEQGGFYIFIDFGCSQIYQQNKRVNFKCKTKEFAPKEQVENSTTIGPKSDVYSLGRTLQYIYDKLAHIINAKFGDNFQFVGKFKKIIDENMVQESIDKRLEGQELHKLFLQEIMVERYKGFLIKYIKSIEEFNQLVHFDENKDIPYYSSINVYYLNTSLSISQFLDFSKNEIAQKYYNLGNFYIQIQDFQNGLDFSKQSLLIRKELSKEFEIIKKIAQKYQIQDFNNCFSFSDQSLFISKEVREDIIKIGQSMLNVGICYYQDTNLDLAMEYFQQSLELAEFLGDDGLKSQNFYFLAGYYFTKNYYQRSLEYSKKALELREQYLEKNNILLAYSYQQYAIILQNQESLNFFQAALEILNKIFKGKHILKIKILVNKAVHSYLFLNSEDSLIYLFQALRMNKEIHNNPEFMNSRIYNNIAYIYNTLNNHFTAFIYILKSLKNVRKVKLSNPLILDYIYDNLWKTIFMMNLFKQY